MFYPEDWAIIVGIGDYPGLSNLDGPVNDATEFHRWLVSEFPAGGGVQPGQALLIRSSDYPGPFADPLDAHPAQADIERELRRMDSRAQKNNAASKGLRVGRRLYLFVSGHGCSVEENDALLAADATPSQAGLHIPCRLWSKLFLNRGYFDEVVLLMDCCRGEWPTVTVRKPPLDLTIADIDAAEIGRRFYGFATKWRRDAKELQFNGSVYGVFTYALLEGLSGKAADPGTGLVTAASLESWMDANIGWYRNTPQPAGNTPQPAGNAPQPASDAALPTFDFDRKDPEPLVFARAKPPEYRRRIACGPAVVGTTVVIQAGDAERSEIARVSAAPPFWDVKLFKGSYQAIAFAAAKTKVFSVERDGEPDVQL